jgi:hypothetical protein
MGIAMKIKGRQTGQPDRVTSEVISGTVNQTCLKGKTEWDTIPGSHSNPGSHSSL